MNGIASLPPRYSYNPATQSYTLLTPEQQANQMGAAQKYDYAGDGGYQADPSPFSQMTPTEQAAYYAENPTMAAVTQMGQQAFGLTSLGMMQNMMDPVGVAQAQTVAQGIDPSLSTALGRTNTQQVTPIDPVPADPTIALTQMNQQQTEEETQVSPVDVAMGIAEAVGVDAVDAATSTTGAPSTSTDTSGSAMGDSGAGIGGYSTESTVGVDANDAPGDDSASDSDSDSDSDGGWRMGGRVMNYEQGGITSLANQVQSQGRGQDKMLVHMTPREVQGLQYLAMRHGGSLSINPRTGLVEAGFLSSILPMVAGAALAATGVGAPMAALMVGGGYGLATGSLTKGLMAGLGAFGGAGIGAGLSAAGATASPALTGTSAGLAGAPELASQTLSQAAPQAIELSGTAADAFGMYPTTPLTSSAAYTPQGLQTLAAQQQADAAMNVIATPSSTVVSPGGFGSTVKQMGTGLSNVVQGTEGARGAFMSSVGGPMGLAKYGGAAAAPLIAGMNEPTGLPIQEQFVRPFKYDPGRKNVPYRTGERGESTAEQTYFDSRFTPVGVYKAGTEPAYGTYAMGGSIEEGVKNGDIRAFDDEYGQDEYYGGGLTALAAGGSPNKPRFLMGKGDGMSDSIPATINDTQPARLADGEFVIPADVVSHLGNGSSKAGAAKLHSMMNRIRKARTGKKRQAPEVRAERYMPA